MDPQVQASLVAAAAAIVVAGMGLLFRKRTKSAITVRRSLDKQEAWEIYGFALRRQIRGLGAVPRPWPPALRYANRDDADEESDDEQS